MKYADSKDKRISAFVVMATAVGQAFKSKEQFRFIETPILIIGAENDERTPVQSNAKHYHRLIQNSRYMELEGEIGHYVFMNKAKSGLKRSAPIIFEDNASVDRRNIHGIISRVVIDFFDSELKEKSQ